MTRATRYARFAFLAALAGAVAMPLPARAGDGLVPKHDQPSRPPTAAAIDEQIGAQVPLELIFRDENDQPISFGDAMAGKPTILVPVYYRCPMLCTEILNELVEALREMPPNFTAGDQFNVVTLSMDPLEHGDLGRLKKKAYLDEYGRPGAENGWRFLTGQKENVAALLDAVGYRFEFDKMMKEYNHPSGLIILSPQGKVTRYFHGLRYKGDFKLDAPEVRGADGRSTRPTTTLRLSLIEAADGKGGSLLDKITLLCYRYDRLHQNYRSVNVLRAVQIAGLITLLAVCAGVFVAFRREGIAGVVLRRAALFVTVFGAVSGLGAASFLSRTGYPDDKTIATVVAALSLLALGAVVVIAYRRGLRAHAQGPTNALPPGGTA